MGNPVLCENSGSRQRDDQSSMIWLGLRPISPHEILLFIFTIEPWNRGITFRCARLWHLTRSQYLLRMANTHPGRLLFECDANFQIVRHVHRTAIDLRWLIRSFPIFAIGSTYAK